MWWEKYNSLNLFNGTVKYICDECEDMIEIRYNDGMLIDVGKAEKDNVYYVTVVSSDDSVGWNNPLAEVAVNDQEDLYDVIQSTIIKFRNN